MNRHRSVIAILSSLLLGSCASVDYKPSDAEHRLIESEIVRKLDIRTGQVVCVYNVLGAKDFGGGLKKFYVIAETIGFVKKNNEAHAESGTVCPVVVTLETQQVDQPGGARTTHVSPSAEVPRDGGYYADDVRMLFPAHLHKPILSGEAAKPLHELIKTKAAAALNVSPDQVHL
jgi:hypothetical protein